MKDIIVVHFNPTGGTKKACMALAPAISQDVKEVDLRTSDWKQTFGPGDVVIVGVPVFGDRIPGFAAEKLKHCHGNRAVVVTAVVCGNWVFEDALLELDDCLRTQEFRTVVGMVLLVERFMVRDITSGRPDKQDMGGIRSFAARILNKPQGRGWQEPQVPGSRPYRDRKQAPAVSVTNDSYTIYGRCAKLCLTGTIPLNAPGTTEVDQCVLRMCCIPVCPTRARSFPTPTLLMLEQKLSPIRNMRQENELLL